MKKILKGMENLSEGRLVASIKGFQPTLTKPSILFTVLENLVQNAFKAEKEIQEGKVQLTVDYMESFPQNAVVCPEGSRQYNRFLSFEVQDRGKGFPQGVPIQNYFSRPAPKIGESGFGLYFVGAVSRIFSMPIDVRTEPGNTKVTIYHPIYGEHFYFSSIN